MAESLFELTVRRVLLGEAVESKPIVPKGSVSVEKQGGAGCRLRA